MTLPIFSNQKDVLNQARKSSQLRGGFNTTKQAPHQMLKGGLKQSQIIDDSSFSRNSNSTNSAPISQDSLGNQKNSTRTTSSKNLKYQEKNPKKPEA